MERQKETQKADFEKEWLAKVAVLTSASPPRLFAGEIKNKNRWIEFGGQNQHEPITLRTPTDEAALA